MMKEPDLSWFLPEDHKSSYPEENPYTFKNFDEIPPKHTSVIKTVLDMKASDFESIDKYILKLIEIIVKLDLKLEDATNQWRHEVFSYKTLQEASWDMTHLSHEEYMKKYTDDYRKMRYDECFHPERIQKEV